ncbi:hypothetical protein D915_000643 [Fasciola hepatica]|uniref:Uncharacterized protein n=1 Tax=Fasciola hepatica TaxID=6192 RepID=A0A4E0S3A0_FASHE|nr:hypothetical protein D915_000643 [Fasciola hepatica]
MIKEIFTFIYSTDISSISQETQYSNLYGFGYLAHMVWCCLRAQLDCCQIVYPAHDGSDNMHFWIRGSFIDHDEVSVDNTHPQRLFHLIVRPNEMDQSCLVQLTETSQNEQKTDRLASFANSIFRNRNIGRLERGSKFQTLLNTLPQQMTQYLCLDC